MSRPVRGSAKSLGKNFTKERIKERINNKLHRTTFPSVRNKLIDTNTPNIAGNIGLQKWANKENLKIVSAEYNKMFTHNLHNFSELEDRIALLHMQQKEVNTSVVSLESQIRHLREMLKYAEQYQSNHIYHVRYQKSKNPDAYLRSHETELLLHDGAENMLKRLGMNPKTLDIDKLRNEYNSLYSKKETLQKTYKSAEKEINALNRKLDNLNQYLNRSSSVQQTNDRKMEKDKTTR